MERITGSMRVRCVHTNSTPLRPGTDGGGGLPLIVISPPRTRRVYGMKRMGMRSPTTIRIAAAMIPIGIHRMRISAFQGVGRWTSRPS